MSKKTLTEIIIAVLLVVVEVIVVLVCRFGEALSADSIDVYMTSLLAIFINIDVLYAIALLIINSHSKNK